MHLATSGSSGQDDPISWTPFTSARSDVCSFDSIGNSDRIIMAIVSIPEKYLPGLRALAELSEPTAKQLTDAVGTAPPAYDADPIVDHVWSKVPTVEVDSIRLVVETLLFLCSARAILNKPLDDFIAEILLNIKVSLGSSWLEGNKEREVKERITTLLKLESIRVTSKARFVTTEYPSLFCSARILTDIRPVFSDDILKVPHHAAVVHQLRIHYHQSRELKEMFLTIDINDIIALKELLERAQEKEATLLTMLEVAGVKSLKGSDE